MDVFTPNQLPTEGRLLLSKDWLLSVATEPQWDKRDGGRASEILSHWP